MGKLLQVLPKSLTHFGALSIIVQHLIQRLPDQHSLALAPMAVEALERSRVEDIALWWLHIAIGNVWVGILVAAIVQAPAAKFARAAAAVERCAPLKIEESLLAAWAPATARSEWSLGSDRARVRGLSSDSALRVGPKVRWMCGCVGVSVCGYGCVCVCGCVALGDLMWVIWGWG